MKLTTRDVVTLYDIIGKIAERQDLNTAPVDVKFLLVRNARAVQDIWAEFMQARQTLLMENSRPVENSENRQATQEQLDYINKEIAKLEKVEVEVAITPISLSKLEALNLDIIEMNGLYPIIANEEALY